MKKHEIDTVKEKLRVKPLPGNIKVISGESMVKKFEHAKTVSASIKGFKK